MWMCFLRTYVGGQYSDGSPEEALGSPFQELELMRLAMPVGVATVRLSRGQKRTLDVKALAFVLHDFWQGTAPKSVDFVAQVAHALTRRARRGPLAGRTWPLREARQALFPIASARAAE